MPWRGFHVAVWIVALCAAAGLAPLRACAPVTPERAAQERQLCVDLWNATTMRRVYGRDTIAIVSARPCRVTVAIGTDADGRLHKFRCVLNRFGAYACPPYAQERTPDPGTWNARTSSGVLRLDVPPAQKLRFRPPVWATRYEVVDGYIVPFGPKGSRREGVRIVGHARGSCLWHRGNAVTTARCGGRDNWIRDPCFGAIGPVVVGTTLLCPRERGSLAFVRFRVDRT